MGINHINSKHYSIIKLECVFGEGGGGGGGGGGEREERFRGAQLTKH